MAKADLTAQRLRELLHYDADTGLLTWRVQVSNNVTAGEEAGSVRKDGYREVGVGGRLYLAHRLAWLYVHGKWPTNHIDHINGLRADNRITNLRDVTRSVNLQNQRRARSDNKASGLLGVYAYYGRWRAKINIDGKQIHLGTFDTPEQAHAAYIAGKRSIHEGCTI